MSNLQRLQENGKIRHIGVTNVDAAHLDLLICSGFRVASNQVSCSVIDQRVVKGKLGQLCEKYDVGILAYGTLLGGFISEKWLGQPEPHNFEALNWSLRKYLRFIKTAGGWSVFQDVLKVLFEIGQKHRVSMAAVATRYVLDIPGVRAVIVGTRLSQHSEKYLDQNKAIFSLRLDQDDRDLISLAQSHLQPVPGDCGDEYRYAPFLTAAGDLSHHLTQDNERSRKIVDAITNGVRIEYSSGSKWEPIAGYCRAVRIGNRVRVSGTTATSPIPSLSVVGGSSVVAQTTAVLDIIERALTQLGASLSDVVRTRIILSQEREAIEASEVHGRVFARAGVRPATTLIFAGLISAHFLVEIEADAEVSGGQVKVLSI